MHTMQHPIHETIEKTARHQTSRRDMMVGGSRLAGATALALAIGGVAGARLNGALAQDATPDATAADAPFASEVDVVNYALTLEHIESTFYREGLAQFDDQAFIDVGLEVSVREYLAEIGAHEATHVEVLTGVVESLGGTPVQEAVYEFGYTDLTSFFEVAALLENTGVDAYTGAAQYLIDEDELLTAALTIHGVEARHAAYLNVLTGVSPFPDAVDAPQTPEEVLAIAGPLIVGEGGADADVDDDDALEVVGTPEG